MSLKSDTKSISKDTKQEETMQYSQLCWICLAKVERNFKNMTETCYNDIPYLTIYCETVGKKIIPSEKYSPRICSSCEIEMLEAYQFRLKCLIAGAKISKLIEPEKSTTDGATQQNPPMDKGNITTPMGTEAVAGSLSDGVEKIKTEEDFKSKERRKKFRCKVCRVIHEKFEQFRRHKCMSYEPQIIKEIKLMTPIYYKVPAVPQINRRPKNPAVVDAKTKQEKQKAAFTCERCGKTLTNRQGFLMHMDKHNNTARYKCDQCDQKFIHWLSRRTHIYRVHLKKPYCTCQHCGKSFYQIKDMRTHILEFHTAEHKGYQCEICGKNFRTRSSFNDHKNVHKSGVECKVCGKMLKTKKTYFKHLEGHTGARHYACSVCDRTYTCNNLLKRHMKHKHPDKIHLLPPSGTIVNKAYLKKKGLQHPIPHPQQSTSQNSLSLKLTK